MRTRIGFGSLLALVLVSPDVARSEEVGFFIPLLREVITSAHPLRRDVKVSVGEFKEGCFQQLTLERRDSDGEVVASLKARGVEVWQLDYKAMQVLVFIRSGKFSCGGTTGEFVDTALWVPIFPRK
jgi:hypothetical protein